MNKFEVARTAVIRFQSKDTSIEICRKNYIAWMFIWMQLMAFYGNVSWGGKYTTVFIFKKYRAKSPPKPPHWKLYPRAI